MTRREISFSPGSAPPLDGQSRLVSTELRAERTRFNWSAQQSQPFVDPAWPIQDLRGRFFGRTSFLRPGKTLIKTLPVPLHFYGLRETERQRERERVITNAAQLDVSAPTNRPPLTPFRFDFAFEESSPNRFLRFLVRGWRSFFFFFFFFVKNVIEDGWLIREWARKCPSSS